MHNIFLLWKKKYTLILTKYVIFTGVVFWNIALSLKINFPLLLSLNIIWRKRESKIYYDIYLFSF